MAFRQTFKYAAKDATHFFPGHMSRGLKDMQKTLKDVDCVLEIHDARIPFSGRNPVLMEAVGLRPHILVLNKMDLADNKSKSTVREMLHSQGINNLIYTNCREGFTHTIKRKVIPYTMKVLENSPRYHREMCDEYNMLVIGVPNVGKSSFINAMRRMHMNKGKATPVGAKAGVTMSVMEKIKVANNPIIYLLDTPGIMIPNIKSPEVGMKLALCGTLKDHLVGEMYMADFILYWMNKHQRFEYTHIYGLDGPTDDINYLLAHICKQENAVQKKKIGGAYTYLPNFNKAAGIVIRDFREGTLGYVNLDIDDVEGFERRKELDVMLR